MTTKPHQIDWTPLLKHLSKNFATKHKLQILRQELLEKISSLPTKEEFFTAMDKWMKVASTADLEKPLHKRDHEKIRKFLALQQ